MKIRKGNIYRYNGRGVKLIERSKAFGPGHWYARYLSDDADDLIVHEKELEETDLNPAALEAKIARRGR